MGALCCYFSEPFFERYGKVVHATLDELGVDREIALLRQDGHLDRAVLQKVEIAFYSRDQYVARDRTFVQSLDDAPNLRWLHVFHAGIDTRTYGQLLRRGVALTTSSGSHAEPIAQTVIGALLWFARGFSHWREAQARRQWEPVAPNEAPRDVRGQTAIVVGVGAIGTHVCRMAKALGLHVIGIRRSPQRPDEPVEEMHPPDALRQLLPRADWLILACPLTDQTRNLIDADALARLPEHAHVLNVSRGAVVDESALTQALATGLIAGAYLDVFQEEPLPQESALWGLPNVLISPHNSAISSGNDDRATDIFLENLRNWVGGTELRNRVRTD